MGQYDRHVFVCTSGDTCPTQADAERYVKVLRDSARAAGKQTDVRINKSGCFNQCGHGPMIVVYPENVWYAGVKESDLEEIVTSVRRVTDIIAEISAASQEQSEPLSRTPTH